jgi:hypothetical protein
MGVSRKGEKMCKMTHEVDGQEAQRRGINTEYEQWYSQIED